MFELWIGFGTLMLMVLFVMFMGAAIGLTYGLLRYLKPGQIFAVGLGFVFMLCMCHLLGQIILEYLPL